MALACVLVPSSKIILLLLEHIISASDLAPVCSGLLLHGYLWLTQ
jgi:hypothetical protein